MAIFLTGSTGYIGAHIAAILLDRHTDRLNLLVRAKTEQEATERLWHALQLHLDFPQVRDALETRISIFRGDLTDPRFGLDDGEYDRLVGTTESVIHCAASLTRKSEKSCLNVNLRGTLEVAQLARRAQDGHGLRRFSQVSTVAVAGVRSHEVVTEDASIDWNRSDYDPYARTKKFCEHMVRELLPEVPRTVFRPSIVLGDSRRAETTQFDMVRAFVFLAGPPERWDRHRSCGLRCRIGRHAPSETGSAARDLPPILRYRRRDSQPANARDRAGCWKNGTPVLARARTSVLLRRELASGLSRRIRPQRVVAESFHGVPGMGHRVRQLASP